MQARYTASASAAFGGVCGNSDGEFQFVTDAAQDTDGNYYVAQYGDYDRIQKFTADHKFVLSWGEHGGVPGRNRGPLRGAEVVRAGQCDVSAYGAVGARREP